MHDIKITLNLLFEQIYQIAESNRIETFFTRIGILYFVVGLASYWSLIYVGGLKSMELQVRRTYDVAVSNSF